ncbi:MAG: hypothetical protein HQ568_11510, partial [Calditrichaeota bacterium]|nr:hypothetical protein [Calditrichota bacterium]
MISNYILQTFIIRKWTIVFIILFVILMGIGSPYPYVGIGFFLILMFFGIIGKCIIPESILISESTIAEQGLVQNQAYRLTVIIASGIGFSIIVWTISAYLFKSITYGTVLLLLILVFEIIKYYKSKRVYTSPPLHDKILLLSIMSIALGFYHYGLNEVIINNYYYNSFRWDLGIHVYNSAIIKNCGLPQLNMIGIPQYAPVCHVGLPVLLSGVSQITLTSLYQSSRIIAIIGYLLLSLGVLSLIKVEKYNSIIVVFASFSVLIWGSLNLPFDLALGNWSGVLDPYYRSAGKIGCASGSYYHNLPQLWSMVFAGVSFISYDKFAKYRNKHDLYLCTAYIVVSGLIKPSTAIILVPALLIIMVLGR